MRGPGADVIIVGAGVIGACIGYELALSGAKVHLVDGGEDPASGCSRANAGLIAPSHSEPLTGADSVRTGLRSIFQRDASVNIRPSFGMVPWLVRFGMSSGATQVSSATRTLRDLGLDSLRQYRRYHDLGVDTSFEANGLVDVFDNGAALEKAVRSLESAPLDLHYDVLDAHQVQRQIPGIANVQGGIHFRHEAQCDSRKLVESLLQEARALGAEISLGTRTRALVRDGDRVTGVETNRGRFEADHVVVSAGHQSAALARSVGVRLPIAPAKGYVVDLEPGPGDPGHPVGVKGSMIVITPYRNRVRLAGTLELVGMDTSIDEQRTSAIREAANLTLPALSQRRTLSKWAGLRPCSADGLPVIGPSSVVKNLILATGHGQQGVLLAPGTARLVARMLNGSSVDQQRPFSPDRFSNSWRMARTQRKS